LTFHLLEIDFSFIKHSCLRLFKYPVNVALGTRL
jgi:hypothetical protein